MAFFQFKDELQISFSEVVKLEDKYKKEAEAKLKAEQDRLKAEADKVKAEAERKAKEEADKLKNKAKDEIGKGVKDLFKKK